MKERVSVIIPVYNVETYLHKCVDSVLAQSYTNLEIILVDDGSLDNCGKICDEYAVIDNRVKVIHKANGGVSSARNAALDVCTGEYVAFVDSDDYVDKNYISTFMKYAEPYSIVCSGFRYIKGDKQISHFTEKKFEVSGLKYVEIIQENLLASYRCGEYRKNPFIIGLWNKLYHKEIFEKIRFPVGKVYEDGYVIFELLLKCKKVFVLPEVTYNYIYRKTSICNSMQSKKDRYDYIDSKLRQEQIVEDFVALRNNAKKIIATLYMSLYINSIRGNLVLTQHELEDIFGYLEKNKKIITFKDKRIFVRLILVSHCKSILKIVIKVKDYFWK